jgi:hypothetical protein
MLPKIKIQTPDGVKSFLFAQNSVAYEQGIADGEITEGMDIVYRNYMVHVLSDMTMLMLIELLPPAPQINWTFVGGV